MKNFSNPKHVCFAFSSSIFSPHTTNQYPRLTDIHQEELIPINSTSSAFAIKHQQLAHSPQDLELDKAGREKGPDRFYHQANHHPHGHQSTRTGAGTYRDEEISEAEINLKGIEDFLMTNRVPESCV